MKYVSFSLVILFCTGLLPADELLPHPFINLTVTHNGKLHKNFSCQLINLDETTNRGTLVSRSGKVYALEIHPSSMDKAKSAIAFYETSLKEVAEELALEEARRGTPGKHGPVILKDEEDPFCFLEVSYDDIVKRYGPPRETVKTKKNPNTVDVKIIKYTRENWYVELRFVEGVCQWGWIQARTGNLSEKQVKTILSLNSKSRFWNTPAGLQSKDETRTAEVHYKPYTTRPSSHSGWFTPYDLAVMFSPDTHHRASILLYTTKYKNRNHEIREQAMKKVREQRAKHKFVKVTTDEQRQRGLELMRNRFESLLKKANSRDALSQYLVADCYLNGRGTKKNIKEATYWMERAAKNGSFEGRFWVADATLNGYWDISKNRKLAIMMFKDLADEQGVGRATRKLSGLGIQYTPKKKK